MGMFDYVKNDIISCPKCGENHLLALQTKSFDCNLDKLSITKVLKAADYLSVSISGSCFKCNGYFTLQVKENNKILFYDRKDLIKTIQLKEKKLYEIIEIEEDEYYED